MSVGDGQGNDNDSRYWHRFEQICRSFYRSVAEIRLGNGHVIQRLLRRGLRNLTGIDYSEKSIALSRQQIGPDIPLHVMDMTSAETSSSSLGHFDVGIDKGTLDAILLCSSDQRAQKRQAYVDTVHRHINNLLFLVSCNWTRNELVEFFQPSNLLLLKPIDNKRFFA